jgi:hypothetical protein
MAASGGSAGFSCSISGGACGGIGLASQFEAQGASPVRGAFVARLLLPGRHRRSLMVGGVWAARGL